VSIGTIVRLGDEMGNRDTKRQERFIADAYEPLNILAVSLGDERVVLSAQDFEKLLACRDIVLFALNSKKDIPYSLVKDVLSSYG
jgi:hypothetical protein